MLPSTHRLRRSADFRQAVRRGARAGRGTVVAHVVVGDESIERAPSTAVQVGFVVSKAVGNSVRRNRVKRRLREIVRPYVGPDSPVTLPDGALMVIRALPTASTATFAVLSQDVRAAVAKAVARAGHTSHPPADAKVVTA